MKNKPIIVFDLETTGVSITKDRIVQIGAVKINGDSREEKNILVNPTIPIPEEASCVHGILDKDVKDAPLFNQIAKSMRDWFSGCDIAGYNSNNFDVPLLMEEFNRCGMSFPDKGTKFIDVIKLERKLNSHKLTDTYERYTGQKLTDAHDALADVNATLAVFMRQKDKIGTSDIDAIIAFQEEDSDIVDLTGKLIRNENGDICYGFGKNKGMRVVDDISYAKWMLKGEFAIDTKNILQDIIK